MKTHYRVLFVTLLLGVATNAFALKDCRCVAATGGWKTGIVYDYGVIERYRDLDVQAPGKCSRACSDKVSGKVSISDATAICAANNWVGGCVRGYGYIGAIGTNNADGTAGLLSCTRPVPAVTQQKCPQGWVSNTTSQDGGITTDGKCKRLACQPIPAPPPPNGTPIGTWGFTWGNAVYQWGQPNTIVITPAQPGSGTWGTCP